MGHGQGGLCFYHHCQRLIDGIAFNMPAGQARKLEIVMRVGGFGHFAEPEIKAFRKGVVAWIRQ